MTPKLVPLNPMDLDLFSEILRSLSESGGRLHLQADAFDGRWRCALSGKQSDGLVHDSMTEGETAGEVLREALRGLTGSVPRGAA